MLSVNVPTSWLKIQIDTGQEFYKGHRLEGTKTKNYLFFFTITDDAVLTQISRTESLLPKQSGVFSHYYMVRHCQTSETTTKCGSVTFAALFAIPLHRGFTMYLCMSIFLYYNLSTEFLIVNL